MKKLIKTFLKYFQQEEYKTEQEKKWFLIKDELMKTINVNFSDHNLLKAALTHNSFLGAEKHLSTKTSPFERLEFLGDAVLELIVTEMLFITYPEKREGHLSKIKSKIVSAKNLAARSQKFNLGKYIILSNEEDKSGGRKRKSILADAMESLMGAIYLEHGLKGAKKFIDKFVLEDFEKDIKKEILINYKSKLQEYTQGKYKNTPEYKIISQTGPDHEKVFIIDALVNGEVLGRGEGRNKKTAQQNAARKVCKKLDL